MLRFSFVNLSGFHCIASALNSCISVYVRANNGCNLIYDIISVFYFLFIAPPRALTNEPQGEIRVKAGQAVRLHCSVDADPPALLQWTKDDEGIHSGWERFKVGQGSLRIKDVTEDDSGHYVCRATNGFGSVNIEHDLYVISKKLGYTSQ